MKRDKYVNMNTDIEMDTIEDGVIKPQLKLVGHILGGYLLVDFNDIKKSWVSPLRTEKLYGAYLVRRDLQKKDKFYVRKYAINHAPNKLLPVIQTICRSHVII